MKLFHKFDAYDLLNQSKYQEEYDFLLSTLNKKLIVNDGYFNLETINN